MKRLFMAAALAGMLGACEVNVGSGGNDNEASNEVGLRGSIGSSGASSSQATSRFVNSRENARSPNLQRNYVDFSFDYPSNWAITPQPTDGTASNYVRVAAPAVDNYEPYAFHVGQAYGSGDAAADRRDLEQALPQIAAQFGSTLQNYQVTSMGPARFGNYDSWGWRFSASAPSLGGSAPAQVYGRGDIILPPGQTKGVLILTLVTDRAGDVTSPDQVGESGPLRAVFDSFQLGAGAGSGLSG